MGVNTFLAPTPAGPAEPIELARSTEEEKQRQLARLRDFQSRHAARSGGRPRGTAPDRARGGNIFAELMDTVRHASLGEITATLFEVGGAYRRNV